MKYLTQIEGAFTMLAPQISSSFGSRGSPKGVSLYNQLQRQQFRRTPLSLQGKQISFTRLTQAITLSLSRRQLYCNDRQLSKKLVTWKKKKKFHKTNKNYNALIIKEIESLQSQQVIKKVSRVKQNLSQARLTKNHVKLWDF